MSLNSWGLALCMTSAFGLGLALGLSWAFRWIPAKINALLDCHSDALRSLLDTQYDLVQLVLDYAERRKDPES